MSRPHRVRLLALCLLAFCLAWANPAWGGHCRLPCSAEKSQAAESPTPEAREDACLPVSGATSGQPALSSFSPLLKLINVYPNENKCPAALMALAGQAETQGWVDLALKVYTFTASLFPDSPHAMRARLKRLTLEFYSDLGSVDPFSAFQTFLERLSPLSSGFSPEDLQEPLAAGWQAIGEAAGRQTSAFASALEKALALWEMHPPGAQPPQGALVLGQLLKNQGLFEEAGVLLSQAYDQGAGQVRIRALFELLHWTWNSRALPGFLEALKHWSQKTPEFILALKTWRLQLGPDECPDSDCLSAALADGLQELSPDASVPSASGQMPVIADRHLREVLLSQPLPAPLQDYFAYGAARRLCRRGKFSEARRLYQNILARTADREVSLFLWDRLGLLHLRQSQWELAQDIFQNLEKEPSRFWQLVARTRQLDLELNRLLAAAPLR